jgi:RNA polymerase sigma-70 factor, ECF subfamily
MDAATLYIEAGTNRFPSSAFRPDAPSAGSVRVPPMNPGPEVPALMQRIALRDDKALEELYARFSKALYNVIYAIVKRKEDAEEILCDIFFQVWEKAPVYDVSKGSVYTWLLAMARNRSIDRLRSKGYKSSRAESGQEPDDMAGMDASNQLDNVVLAQRAAIVKSALGRISPEQRRVLETAYFEGRSQTEIATDLGIPLGTVKSRVRDGMKAMQSLLKDLI